MRFHLIIFFTFSATTFLFSFEHPILFDVAYCHTNVKLTIATAYIKNFEAYTSYFDPSGTSTPLAVEYQIKGGKTPGKNKRPSSWTYDSGLHQLHVMATDQAYRNSGYDRGHLCMKEIGSFISPDADWNTHTLWNCVPQTHELNAGIWLDLEKKTIAWANTYQDIWVICGPYYSNRQTAIKIGDEQSGTISVPPYTWKIVVRTNSWHVVAAMYDQNISIKGPFDHHPYLLSVLDIENKTGIKVGIPDSLKNQTNDFEHF